MQGGHAALLRRGAPGPTSPTGRSPLPQDLGSEEQKDLKSLGEMQDQKRGPGPDSDSGAICGPRYRGGCSSTRDAGSTVPGAGGALAAAPGPGRRLPSRLAPAHCHRVTGSAQTPRCHAGADGRHGGSISAHAELMSCPLSCCSCFPLLRGGVAALQSHGARPPQPALGMPKKHRAWGWAVGRTAVCVSTGTQHK